LELNLQSNLPHVILSPGGVATTAKTLCAVLKEVSSLSAFLATLLYHTTFTSIKQNRSMVKGVLIK